MIQKCLVVEKSAVENNIAVVRRKAGGMIVYGVLKSGGYGLGLLELARILRDNGITAFAVTEPSDVVTLRNSGFLDEEILVMRSTGIVEEIETLIDYNATATIGSYDAAVAANGIAESRRTVLNVHIKVDTGMGRYGFNPGETDKILAIFRYMPNLAVSGLYTHLSRAWMGEKAVKPQTDALQRVAAVMRKNNFDPGILHAANSSALLKEYPCAKLDAVRVGSALTGRVAVKGSFGLIPVGKAQCPVTEVRWLGKGQSIGYGGSYICRKPTKIAVIPLGYTDGFCIEKARDSFRLSDTVRYGLSTLKAFLTRRRLYVEICGKQARVLGHVGMQHTVADVTEIDCAAGEIASFSVNPLIAGVMLRKKYV